MGCCVQATPNWMTTILLALLLTLLTYKLMDRAVATWRKENLEFKRAAANSDATEPLLQGGAQEHQQILHQAFAPTGDPLPPPFPFYTVRLLPTSPD